MRSQVRIVTPPSRSEPYIKYGVALICCITSGYLTYMGTPYIVKLLKPESQHTAIISGQQKSTTEPNVVFTPVEAPERPIASPVKNGNGTYAKLTECRLALQANHGYGGFTAAEAATVAVSRVGAMSPTQIREVCRLITEGLVRPPR